MNRTHFYAFIICTLASLVSSCGGGGGATNSPDNGSELGPGTDSTNNQNTPDNSAANSTPKIVYRADVPVNGQYQLYAAALAGGEPSVKVNGPLSSLNGNVSKFAIAPNKQHIAYLADQDTNGTAELYIGDFIGSNTVKINDPLPSFGIVSAFQWSPDSTHVAYLAEQTADKTVELYVATPDGASKIKVSTTVTGGNVDRFSFSPDGTRLAYVAKLSSDSSQELYSVKIDGTDNRKINGTLVDYGFVVDFEWSPDSQHVAYKAYQEAPTTTELYVSKSNGTQNRKISQALDADAFFGVNYYHWAPDSSRVAFIADHVGDAMQLYSAAAASIDTKLINSALAASAYIRSFHWSHDSQQIAYVDSLRKLYSNSAVGGEELALNHPDGSNLTAVRWLADSSSVVYLADNELYVSSDDGLEMRKLNSELAAGGEVWGYKLSPDNGSVLYIAEQDIQGFTELYLASLDRTGVQKISKPLKSYFTSILKYEWSDDGSDILYAAAQMDQGAGVYRVAVDDINTTTNITGDLGTGSAVSDFSASGNDRVVK